MLSYAQLSLFCPKICSTLTTCTNTSVSTIRWPFETYRILKTAFTSFVWISEQTAMIALHKNNHLFIMTQTEYIYCAVRTESINTTNI